MLCVRRLRIGQSYPACHGRQARERRRNWPDARLGRAAVGIGDGRHVAGVILHGCVSQRIWPGKRTAATAGNVAWRWRITSPVFDPEITKSPLLWITTNNRDPKLCIKPLIFGSPLIVAIQYFTKRPLHFANMPLSSIPLGSSVLPRCLLVAPPDSGDLPTFRTERIIPCLISGTRFPPFSSESPLRAGNQRHAQDSGEEGQLEELVKD